VVGATGRAWDQPYFRIDTHGFPPINVNCIDPASGVGSGGFVSGVGAGYRGRYGEHS